MNIIVAMSNKRKTKRSDGVEQGATMSNNKRSNNVEQGATKVTTLRKEHQKERQEQQQQHRIRSIVEQ
jgi:hypothetical protein